jgi:valyl-tRNA synthetase
VIIALTCHSFYFREQFGVIHTFYYPIADSKEGERLMIATTRIETMVGDSAVAVHPDDTRYKVPII